MVTFCSQFHLECPEGQRDIKRDVEKERGVERVCVREMDTVKARQRHAGIVGARFARVGFSAPTRAGIILHKVLIFREREREFERERERESE